MNKKTLDVLEYYKIINKLTDKAESQLGKTKTREVTPIKDIDKIEFLQRQTKEALSLLIDIGNPPLYGIFDISKELRMIEIGGALGPGSLIEISDSLRVSRSLKAYLKGMKDDELSRYEIINGLINELSTFEYIEDKINNAIISEKEISDKASPGLRRVRREIINKNQSVRSKLDGIVNSQRYKRYLQDSIVTMREGRYVVPIKQENKSYFPGLVHDQSASGATLFVEPMAVVELNNELKELEIKERKEIEKILEELSALVAEKSGSIKANQSVLQNLDFIFAKGKLALDMKAIMPALNSDGYIDIKQARHPLLDVKDVVPIDVNMGKDFNSLVITGPNTGGKTVTLKTVGLLTVIAQSGLHIPADSNSQIAIFDQVFADIGDEQSIEQSLSTFSSHMTNIVNILENVKDNSLVLLDELGAGTDPTEGAALAMSILDHLIKYNIRTMATTHYSQLKIYALTTDGIKNAAVEFDVETLRPTYKVLIGVPGKSNAFEISKRLGLQDYIIDEAKNLVSKENVEFEDALLEIDKDRRITEENKFEAEKLRFEVEGLKEELDQEKERAEKSKDKIILKAKEQARSILRIAKDESDNIVSELRKISSDIEKDKNKQIHDSQGRLKSQLDEVEGSLAKNLLNVKSQKPPSNLKIGDTVEVLSLNQIGNVSELPDENGNLQVQVGVMKVNVHNSTLRRAKDKEVERVETQTRNIIKSKVSVKNELDLRGKTLSEALLDLDKYIDDVYIAGLDEVSIIHGKGTGVLREGVNSYMKGNRSIKSFRIGERGEGGDGVTIVNLK